MKKIRFFYHDETLKRKWITQQIGDESEETQVGCFEKERYPFGFSSTFIFVDHCDFDSADKVKAVFYGTSDEKSKDFGKKGIVGTGLTATKSIFVDAEGTENIGIEKKDYRKVIEKLYQDGVEIVPHSLTPRDSLIKRSERLKKYFVELNKFKPQTWIDHGYALSNIIRSGTFLESPYYIFGELYKRGYRYFWTRIDYSLNAPDGNLNVFNSAGRAGKDYFKKVIRLIRGRVQLRKILFVFFWEFIGCLTGWEAKDDLVYAFDTTLYFLKKITNKNIPPPHAFSRRAIIRTLIRAISPVFYFNILHNLFSTNEITGLTQGFYPVLINGKRVLFFDSLWVNDYDNCYSPQNINRLIDEKGLHVGHNYFCVEEKHYLSSSFIKKGKHYFISDKFQKNLEYLSLCQRKKGVWVTTIGKFGNYYSKWLKIKIEKITDRRLFLKNLGNDKIEGITFSLKLNEFKKLKFSKPKEYQSLTKGLVVYFWFDMIPGEEIEFFT